METTIAEELKIGTFPPQLSVSTCDAAEVEAPMGRAISGASTCSSEEDSAMRQQRLWVRAMDSHWKLSRKDLQMKKELSRTLKSTLYHASWQGVDVVVKCAGLHDDATSRQLQSSAQSLQRTFLEVPHAAVD